MAVAPTVFAGSPVPFDPAEIDKKLAAAHTLNTLAQTTNRVLFDLYDHCAVAKSVLLDRPAGHALVAAPLHDGDRVQGLLEFVIPREWSRRRVIGCRAAI